MYRSPPLAALTLMLSGNCWHIIAGDADASAVVDKFGQVMSLPPAGSSFPEREGEQWRELRVITDPGPGNTPTGYYGSSTLFCRLPPIRNLDRLHFGLSLVALAIARAELTRGGLLIHGALAAAPDTIGGGIIMAGPAEAGKTTASNRLPPSWRSLSDDTTLIVRDLHGQYMAHPWPTWSRFFYAEDTLPNPDKKWNVQEGVCLRGIYFLKQAKKDRVSVLPAAPAMTYLMETVQLVSSLMASDLSIDQAQELHQSQFIATEGLIRSIPSYILYLSLTGNFWVHIEKNSTLCPSAIAQGKKNVPAIQGGSAREKFAGQSSRDDDIMNVCYSGPSMNPTLRMPDILEVTPYCGKQLRRGDIIYYQSPVDDLKVIHRVVSITADGIYTRGDNNPADDLYILQQEDIIGRVSAAWRQGNYRKITGGVSGTWSGYLARIYNRLNRSLSPVLHVIYRFLSARCFFCNILPASLQPRVFEFKHRYQPSRLKLLVRGHVIGHYDIWRKCWLIDRPWRLIVDETTLPDHLPE